MSAASPPRLRHHSPQRSARYRQPLLEKLEDRCLLSGEPGMVDGLKWHDIDGNGRWDRGEPALSGWLILAEQNGRVMDAALTMEDDPTTPLVDETGLYWLTLEPGTYTLREVPFEGWIQTYPGTGGGTHTIVVEPHGQIYGEFGVAMPPNFGNFLPAAARGRITHQQPDCTGMRDRGGQAGVQVQLDRQVGGQFQAFATTMTAADGSYSFGLLPPGTYRVSQVVRGWTELSRPPATFVLTAGQNRIGLDFRNELPLDMDARCGALSGRVVHQIPTCTVPDDRGGRAGVRVYIDVNNNAQLDTTEPRAVTDAAGNYRLADLGRGSYRIRVEVLNPEWSILGPALYDVTQTSPIFNVTGLDFRLQVPPEVPLACGTITGRVTHQVPTCSVPEDRGGLGGVTVYVDLNRNGQPDVGEPRGVTDAGGNYRITPLGAGSYRVRPALQSNWVLLDRPFADLTQQSPTFNVTGIDFRIEVRPDVPPQCVPPISDVGRKLLPVFGGGIPALLASGLGGKMQLIGSTLANQAQNGDLLAQTAFVTGLYRHLFNRSADAAGLTLWVQQLQGGVSRAQVIATFWNSTEHRMIQVDYYYDAFLGRRPDPAGRAAWVSALAGALSEKDFLGRILGSAEYATKLGPDNATYVARLYLQLLGRPAETAGHAAWVQALQTGTSRETVALALLNSREASRHIVDLLYTNFLDRRADPAGEQAWLAALASGRQSWGSVAQMILGSDEYLRRMESLAKGSAS